MTVFWYCKNTTFKLNTKTFYAVIKHSFATSICTIIIAFTIFPNDTVTTS